MPSGLIIGGAPERVPGLDVINLLDYPEMWAVPDDPRRARSPSDVPRAIIWHSTRGLPHGREDLPAQVLPGSGTAHGPRQCSYELWDHAERCPGAHLVVDHDGSVYQVADPLADTTSWCPAWSRWAVNVALYQGRDGETHEAQLSAAVVLTDTLTRRLSVQRQIPHQYLGPVPRLASAARDVVGVFGHRDASKIRGPGDPGSPLFYRLGLAGYDVVDYSLMGDRSLWVRRQREYFVRPDDGIAGPETVAALRAAGVPHGVWVRRPGDAPG